MEDKKTILVIEDDEGLRALLAALLKRNHKVIGASNALMGMNYLYENSTPDLIILDTNLSDISGIDLIAQLKSNAFFKKVPIIALSEEKDKAFISYCHELGIDAYFAKPFNPDYLLLKVGALFGVDYATSNTN
jgi:DNA-binding response OmpR family regulator